MKNNQKGFASSIVIGIVIILIIVGGYFVWKQKSTSSGIVTTPDQTSGQTTYTGHGFQLTLTSAWKGYKVFSSEGSQGVGAPTYVDFALPTIDKTQNVVNVTDTVSGYSAPLTITIIAKDGKYSGTGVKIAEDSNNSYYYTSNTALPADLKQTNFEIPMVISTFKLTQ